MQDFEDDGEQESGGGFRVDLLRSYLDFAKRAVRTHWLLSAALALSGTVLASLAATYWPRTFSCTTVLMPVGNSVLDVRYDPTPLAGAEDLILRHENLETIIREVGLVQKNAARRGGILKLKDRLIRALIGPQTEKTEVAILVGTLTSKIAVTTEKGDLTIKVDWSDGISAAELAAAARESFVKARHVAEMSAFEEKMAILDEHATRLRAEIGRFAEQLETARRDRLNQARGEREAQRKASVVTPDTPVVRVVRAVAPRPAESDTELPALKEKLEALKKKLADLQGERDRKLQEAQAKFEDMKLHLTAAHPDVVTQGQRVAMLSQVPSEVALLQAEVKDVDSEIAQRASFAQQGGSIAALTLGTSSSGARAAASDALPPEITALLQQDDVDPALTAQLSSAITKYASLRGDLLNTRIDLDTAQAAFNHRYQVIIPADPPQKPDKPKPAMIVMVGVLLSFLVSGCLAVALELRKGVLANAWQVEHFLPVLAEVHLPPYSRD
jgi:uncharacterized protein involved in exopolysaccharide biosynthesis